LASARNSVLASSPLGESADEHSTYLFNFLGLHPVSSVENKKIKTIENIVWIDGTPK
jgi:hypothetical protein